MTKSFTARDAVDSVVQSTTEYTQIVKDIKEACNLGKYELLLPFNISQESINKLLENGFNASIVRQVFRGTSTKITW